MQARRALLFDQQSDAPHLQNGLQALLRLIQAGAVAGLARGGPLFSRDDPMDSLFALIGGPKQLPLYAYLATVPIVIVVFIAELRDAMRLTADGRAPIGCSMSSMP